MWSTIVTNLLSNAVKYTPHGGIDIDLHADQNTAVLTVTDTGLGITPDEQTRVFDRFHRAPQATTTTTAAAGAGIGLALVADLVRAHHGTVEVTSAPDHGTTFTISIPRNQDTPAATGHQPEQPATASTRPRLLLVEDDTDLRAYLTRLLTDDGWHVHPVPDAETALAAATDPAGPSTDLVLTDLVLPGHSGLHLVTELRAARRTTRLPIVILTGRGGAEAAATGLAAGADDYITKPFSSLELLARVRANHELHQHREAAIGTAEDRANQIRAGLESNRVIGTAVGVVMATYRLTAHQGFQLLVAASQHTNSKLRDIAADVAATGTLALRPTLIDELLIRVHPDHNNDHDHTATRTRPTAGAAADPT
jgi:DNA-binding response OmpR family regulator